MKTTITILFALLVTFAVNAATVPMYLTGAAGASYVVAGTAAVTTTNTTVLYTNITMSITNLIGGTNGESMSLTWRGNTKEYIFTNSATESGHIAVGSNTTNSLFNVMAKLQNDFGLVRVKDYNQTTFTVSCPVDDGLIFTNNSATVSDAYSNYYDMQTAYEAVSLKANPLVLASQQIIYVSGVTINTNTYALTLSYTTNTIPVIQ